MAAVGGFVRHGSRLLDVGSDHAYLPIWLYKTGRIGFAAASDVNPEPCRRARENIRQSGLDGVIDVYEADGLDCLDCVMPDDITIAGMGGELISSVISAQPLVRNSKYRLILQPMTMQSALRRYLYENGFDIIDEAITRDGKKLYQTIVAVFDGVSHSFTETELILGRCNIRQGGEYFIPFLERNIFLLEKIITGRSRAGIPTAGLQKIKSEMECILNENKRALQPT